MGQIERLLSRVQETPDGCWLWTGGCNGHGYGTASAPRSSGQRSWLAHRLVYSLMRGPIPDGMDLDHECHNADPGCRGGISCPHRRCVNPSHLVPATRLENVRRSMATASAHGRSAGGRTAGRITGEQNRAKTHCPRGHFYDDANTYITSAGARSCRECQRKHSRAWRRRTGG